MVFPQSFMLLVFMVPCVSTLRHAELKAVERLPPSEALRSPSFPAAWPYDEDDLKRQDETDDKLFYAHPRLVTHIDDSAIEALRAHYAKMLPPTDGDVLDICSSWISHYPTGWTGRRVAGVGMNEVELSKNPHLTEHAAHDLNGDPVLPYADSSFDTVTNAVSVDYLSKPKEVFAEIFRVLRPGGVAMMSFSNRCFPSKVIDLWHRTTDTGHIWIVGSYFHYAGFEGIEGVDISLGPGSDPMYVVQARKPSDAHRVRRKEL